MKYWNYICKCYRHYFNFKGRANRTEFWTFAIFTMIIGAILVIIDNHVCPESWHRGFAGLIIESLTSGYSIPYLMHWYEMHPDVPQGFGIITSIWATFNFIPTLSLGVRRLHDINMNGWFIVVGYAPVIGWGWFFIYSLLRGSEGENNYGPEPTEEECGCCCRK